MQYDIYWVDLNPTVGAEINKVRPCVIISPDELNEHLRTVIIAPLTTAVREYYPFRMKVKVDGKEGQIAIDQIRTIDKARLRDRIETLRDRDIDRLRELLREMFCDE
ncbi:MAG: type II toxin-antitoxin system PemK/MazF family toxin [Porphyromonas sp.]|nr:type II toxin-antitoxin system PemK/MazF family toxin [Porphyromonas sp.]